MKIYKDFFSKRLKKRLKDLGLSQSWLVEKTELQQSNISRWMTGESLPKENHFELICRLLKVEPEYFVQSDPPPTIEELSQVIVRQDAELKRIKEMLPEGIFEASDHQIRAIKKILKAGSKKRKESAG